MKNNLEILSSFSPISLKEMDSVKLLNRTDTKFIFNKNLFDLILSKIKNDYQILTINNKKTASYRTLYFDTDLFKFYNDHHNKRGNRYKVRIRKYLDSDLCFLEIKNKRKGRTIKTRTSITDFEDSLSNSSIEFIKEIIPEIEPLETKIWNTFERITLVNQERKERVTIDFNLKFEFNDEKLGIDHLVICELKQERANRNSPINHIFKLMKILPNRVSKYCIGSGLLYEQLKKNRFKEKYLLINKLKAS